MAGGGGDGGFSQRQEAVELSKQKARNAVNVLFGANATGERPSEGDFRIPASAGGGGDGDGGTWIPGGGAEGDVGHWDNGSTDPAPSPGPQAGSLDPAAYQKALAEWQTTNRQSHENKIGRNKLYNNVRRGAFNAGQRDLNEDRSLAQRNLKFELFARGLNGGSADVDENALLGRTYRKGLVDLGAKADAAKAGFRAADEGTRLSLLQSIDSGMDQGSALSSATNQMQVASDRALADAQGTSLGDAFANAGLMYQQGQYRMGRQQGQQQGWNMFPGNNYRPSGNSTAATGAFSNDYSGG